MAPLSDSHKDEVKRFSEGVEQLPNISCRGLRLVDTIRTSSGLVNKVINNHFNSYSINKE